MNYQLPLKEDHIHTVRSNTRLKKTHICMSRLLFKINGTEVPCCPFYCFNIQSEKWKLKRQGAGVGGKKTVYSF